MQIDDKSIKENARVEYPLMRGFMQIGWFIEDTTQKRLKVSIVLFDVDKSPYVFKVRAKGNIIEHNDVMSWINNRVTPRYQDGIEEKVKALGLSEYNAYMFFRLGNGIKISDATWVPFTKSISFLDAHPYGKDIKRFQEEHGLIAK